jgi:polysaccharide biosynthesis protein PslG
VLVRPFLLPLLVLLLVPGSAGAAKRSVPQGFFGAVYDGEVRTAPPDVQARQWALMARSGVESVRVMFSWDEAQPDPSKPPSFELTDRHVENAVRRRIRVLPVVIYAPPWARERPDLFNSPPRRPDDYVAYLRALVLRYGPAGSFWKEHPELPKRPLREYQLWNEVHLRYQWNSDEYVRGYSELLKASYAALKQADRGARVVLAQLTNDSWNVLEELYERGDIEGSFDAVSIAPFTSTAERVVRIARLVRRAMRRHGDARLPLWATEVGWPASKGRVRSSSPLQTSASGQAKLLTRAYELLAESRRDRAVGVTRAYWYTWASSYSGDIFRFAGLQEFDGRAFRRKRSLGAYARAARRYQGCAKTSAGVCR